MKLLIKYNGKILSNDILLAEDFMSRLIGLMFKAKIEGADGLMIDPCRSIHTFFMRYSIDVVFISQKNSVVKIIRDLKPWRLTWIYWRATKTLELPAGNLPQDLKVGDQLEVISV